MLNWANLSGYFQLKNYMPSGLYSRSLMIIIIPIVLIQIVAGYVFLERHWNTVTKRLSHAVISDLSLLVDLRMGDTQTDDVELIRLADESFEMSIAFLPGETLPEPVPRPFVDLLDDSLSDEIENQIGRPFWLDTVSVGNYVDVRLQLPGEVMRALVLKSKVYATNSHIFIVWMTGTSLFLLAVSIVFLRNQIRPIENLAEAAESFGRGRDIQDFKPSGASEVRQAASAFLNMRDRIKAQIEQRTTMLAGVSHDLRTPLTRLKLQLAMLPRSPEILGLEEDIIEMEDMLEDYLSFAKGFQGEKSLEINIRNLLEEIRESAKLRKPGTYIFIACPPSLPFKVKRRAFKRCLTNLVNNACNHAKEVHIIVKMEEECLNIIISDNGPGIPEDSMDQVFRPFFRLDQARNAETGGTGLGLSVARDVARGHGGDIYLSKGAQGGLEATVSVPV
ncbi:MAG: HAMP domain-containing protein [Alphaproteobacteria bacterium]|nr:HAMP domain-containing protein [Alphaproteobacteria bacterium]